MQMVSRRALRNRVKHPYYERSLRQKSFYFVVLLSFCHILQASPEPSIGKSKNVKNRMLEEVIVTAQKREENAQDVPVSIAAFSGDKLAAMGIDDPSDLQAITPGLTYNTANAFSVIYLRGVGSDAFLMADPSVATYIDGIYFPFSSGMMQSFGAVERIEVLKGPQGTLFGRNTTGGAISITTQSPEEEFRADIEAGYSSFDTTKLRLHVSVPVLDSLAFSVSAFRDRSDSYYEYTSDSVQQDFPNEAADGVRFKVRWKISDNLESTLAYLKIDQDSPLAALQVNTAESPLGGALGIEAQPRNHTAEQDLRANFLIDNQVFYGNVVWEATWFDVKFLASDQTMRNRGGVDFDGSNEMIAGFYANPFLADVKTAELQLISTEDSWGSEYLDWIAGIYYIDSRTGLIPGLTLLEDNNGGLLGLPLPDFLALLPSELSDALGGLPITGGLDLALSGLVDTESIAIFSQINWYLSEQLTLTLGGRYQEETRQVVESTFGLRSLDGGSLTVFDYSDVDAENTKNFSPKISFQYRPHDNALLFLSWQQSFKSGAFNTINMTDGVDYAHPEDVEAIELGIKADFIDGMLRLNAAIFQTEIDSLQVQFVSLMNGGSVSFENAGGARIRGADFDLTAQILPEWFEGLVFTFSGAYLDGVYTDYQDGSGFDEETGLFEDGQDFTGNQTVRTPKWSGLIGLSKLTSVSFGAIEVAGDLYYNSGYFYLAQNTDVFAEDEYAVLNMRASLFFDDLNIRLTVFGNNLANEVHAMGQVPNDFGRQEVLAPPRSYGAKINWSF